MDWNEHLREVAHWLVKMANTPGWLEHAKHREQELMASQMYARLPEFVREARLEAGEA